MSLVISYANESHGLIYICLVKYCIPSHDDARFCLLSSFTCIHTLDHKRGSLLLFLKKTSPTQKWENRWILIIFFLSVSLCTHWWMMRGFFFSFLISPSSLSKQRINSFYSPRNKHTAMRTIRSLNETRYFIATFSKCASMAFAVKKQHGNGFQALNTATY